jgi:hypothetical protein
MDNFCIFKQVRVFQVGTVLTFLQQPWGRYLGSHELGEGNLHLEIFRVAYDIYERSGRIKGRDLDNWLEAERIVKALRKIGEADGQKHIFVNVPITRSDEEGEYSKWMIKFFER